MIVKIRGSKEEWNVEAKLMWSC